MKIGIITIHNPPNYGAMLQAYGLSSKLNELGYDAEIVDYRQPAVEEYFKFKLSFPPKINHWLRLKRSKAFVNRKQKLSVKSYRSLEEFSPDANKYDALVCGSDQIWFTGPVQFYDRMYFLDIPNFKGKRVSYAPSVGGANDFGEFESQVSKSLKKIDHLSVRDSHTMGVVKAAAEVEVTKVVDPVLLYSFDELISESPLCSEPYMLIFGNFPDSYAPAVRKLAKEKGISKIITLQYTNEAATDRLPAPTPEQWLSYFKHADFVLTSYFHGTVVAAKFNRPFTAIPTPGRRPKVQTLLSTLGCPERYLEEIKSEGDLIENSAGQINWDFVNGNLSLNIQSSVSFLQKAL